MKDFESIKEYVDKLIEIANKARALGTRLIQKILVLVLERYETTIASLENTKDLSQLKMIDLVSALQAEEHGASKVRLQQGEGGTKKNKKGRKGSGSNSLEITAKDLLGVHVLVRAMHASIVGRRIIHTLDVGEGHM